MTSSTQEDARSHYSFGWVDLWYFVQVFWVENFPSCFRIVSSYKFKHSWHARCRYIWYSTSDSIRALCERAVISLSGLWTLTDFSSGKIKAMRSKLPEGQTLSRDRLLTGNHSRTNRSESLTSRAINPMHLPYLQQDSTPLVNYAIQDPSTLCASFWI